MTAPSYVHPVPDHCDRIVWRGNYYGLPLAAPAQEPPTDQPAAPSAHEPFIMGGMPDADAHEAAGRRADAIRATVELHHVDGIREPVKIIASPSSEDDLCARLRASKPPGPVELMREAAASIEALTKERERLERELSSLRADVAHWGRP